MFPHVRDVEGRKDLIERGQTGAQEEQRYKVTYHPYLARGGGGGGGGGLSYTPSVERVVG